MKTQTLKQTEIGEIPEGWENNKLSELIDIKHGFAFKGEFFTDISNKNILLTPGNFKIGGGFKDNKFKYYNGEIPKDYLLNRNDIIITMTDLSKEGDTLGYAAKIPYSINKNYLHNQRLGLVKFKSKKLDKDFLYWLLRTKNYQIFIVNTSSGSTVKHTSPNRILDYKFINPKNLNEQQAIAKILSDLDTKIELNQQMNKTLEAIGQALFKNWFIDFEFLNEKGKPYKLSGGEMIDSELGEIPKGWRVGNLGEVIINFDSKRIPLSSIEREKKNGNYPYYGAAGILDYIDEYLFDGEYLLLGEDGTVINENENPILQHIYGKFWVNNHAHVLQGKDNFSISYLYLLLKKINIKHIITGAVQPKINQENMNNLEIIIPTEDILIQFNKLINETFKCINLLNEESKNLSQIRDLLLPKLMSGKIRVNIK